MNYRRLLSCLLVCLFSLSIIFSATLTANAKQLNSYDYITSEKYDGDNKIVDYEFDISPYSEAYGYNFNNGSTIYLGTVTGNPIKYAWSSGFNDVFTKIRYTIFPLGYDRDFNYIDISELKSGAEIDLTFSFDVDLIDENIIDLKTPQYIVHWLDVDTMPLSTTPVYFTAENFTNQGYVSGVGNTYSCVKTETLTKPSDAKYFYLELKTDWFTWMKGDNNARAAVQINYIKMNVNLSAFEENSKTMKEISGKLDSMKQEEEKQTGLLGNIVSGITNLPGKIADSIKGLFVPDEEEILEMFDDFEELMIDRFGVLYESKEFLKTYKEDMESALTSATSTYAQTRIPLPVFRINLAGTEYKFGGYRVEIIPDGFEDVIVVLKSITNFIAFALFINAMRKRWDGVFH